MRWPRSPSAASSSAAGVVERLLNRPEFHLLDTAALHLGATPFSVYNTATAERVAYQFANAGNRASR
jgi:hypothetical protein